MPRRAGVRKRDVLPDFVYNSKVVTKVINQIMLDGAKRARFSTCSADGFATPVSASPSSLNDVSTVTPKMRRSGFVSLAASRAYFIISLPPLVWIVSIEIGKPFKLLTAEATVLGIS